MIILKDIKTPQDIWIYSGWLPEGSVKNEVSFRITDDYTGFRVRVEGAKRGLYNLESDGGGTILTVEDMLTPNLFNSDELYDECQFVLLEDFTGQLKIRGVDEDGNDVDFEIDDFIQHEGADDVFIELPQGTKTQLIGFDNIETFLKSYKRDSKLRQIGI